MEKKKNLIKFNESFWGYDFTCIDCGIIDSADGEAPVMTMANMREKGWQFRIDDEIFVPLCPVCKKNHTDLV
ncbi:hypothetical protein QUF70_15860 [Desulfobacterales bacterium HSG17]|nr:hypothetical protein [Desulfobacterales bacterium HSG17]